MPASSILPVALFQGRLYFLFGKENPMEDSAKGFSDFGGSVEDNDNFYDTALRECSEELKGFLGSKEQLRKYIRQNGGFYPISFDNGDRGTYKVHIIKIPYDPNLIEYYNNNHRFLWNKMDKYTLNESRLFEKAEIQWIPESKLKSFLPKMRPFYRKFVETMMDELPKIRAFIRSCHVSRRKRVKRNRTMRGG